LQGLLTARLWDDDDLNRQRLERMLALPTEGDGVLIFDDTGFAQQGKCSVGTAWQYAGTLGKTANGQVTGNCPYAERTLAEPVATRLYLPKEWTADPDRLKKARVPKDVTLPTKPEIALDLLDRAKAWGVRWTCVSVDGDYGDNPNFLAGLEKRKESYVPAVRGAFPVSTAPDAAEAVQRADALVAAQPLRAWRQLRWRQGSKGWLTGQFVAVRCWRLSAAGQRQEGWLLGEQTLTPPSQRKCSWSDFGPEVTQGVLVEDAPRRHGVEQYHEAAKGLRGWDQ
jgi:SRSO17 transposase